MRVYRLGPLRICNLIEQRSIYCNLLFHIITYVINYFTYFNIVIFITNIVIINCIMNSYVITSRRYINFNYTHLRETPPYLIDSISDLTCGRYHNNYYTQMRIKYKILCHYSSIHYVCLMGTIVFFAILSESSLKKFLIDYVDNITYCIFSLHIVYYMLQCL